MTAGDAPRGEAGREPRGGRDAMNAIEMRGVTRGYNSLVAVKDLD